jgi:hypothetical protein
MSNLGIYGDSFADPHHGHDIEPTFHNLGWPNLLDSPVNIYALNGSSIYYTYKKFIENHHRHEKNIVVITNPSRIPIEPSAYVIDQKPWMLGITSAEIADFMIENKFITSQENIEILTAFQYWYDHLMMHSGFYDFSKLMIEQIKRLRPDTIFIPAFSSTDNFNMNISIDGPSLTTYMSLEFNGWFNRTGSQTFYKYYENYPEQRTVCHLTVEGNKLVAEHIKLALDKGAWGSQKMPQKIITSQPYEYYYDTTVSAQFVKSKKLD